MTIYYFSGTGNSLKTARDIAAKCGGTAQSMRVPANAEKHEDAVGFVFPVYFGGVPNAVADFVRRSNFNADYFFTVATFGGSAGNALGQMATLLAEKGLRLDYGAGVRAFPNYIAMYYIPFNQRKTAVKQAKRVAVIADAINRKEKNETAPKPVSVLPTADKDRAFAVKDACTQCGLCVKLCPVGNIEIAGGKPAFKHKCEQCMACIQWCPQKAINTPKTLKRKRYRHPDVTAEDLTR